MSFWPFTSGREEPPERCTITLAELRTGWKRVRQGSDACGVDGQRGGSAEREIEPLLRGLLADLERGTYAPLPFKTSSIPKEDGGHRVLHIPAVRDRIVQQVLARRLGERLEPTFQPCSWAFRPGRGREGAVRHLVATARERGLDWIARVDVRSFFDEIDQDRLLSMLVRRGVPAEEVRLVRLTLGAGVLDGQRVMRSRRGCPQGSPMSPVLSNLYLDEFDRWLEGRYPGSCRYADDMALPCHTEADARRAIDDVRRQLARQLGLAIHQSKSGVVRLAQLVFLGYRFDILHAMEDRPPGVWRSIQVLAEAVGRMIGVRPGKRSRGK